MAYLVPVCLNFLGPKSHILTTTSPKVCLVSIKCNFLEKVAFYNCKENTQVQNEAPEVHFPKVCERFDIFVGVIGQLRNCPSIISSIIKIQTQKHNLKINQTTTIKAKKFLLS